MFADVRWPNHGCVASLEARQSPMRWEPATRRRPCTTNIVESPFASVRLRTTAAKRYKRVDNATALIWKLLWVAEKTFRRLNAPHLLAAVAASAKYVDGIAVPTNPRRVAA